MPNVRKPRQMSRDRLILYAYHEAGHAVVGHVIKRCIKEVSIASDKKQGYQGYCEFSSFIEGANGYPQWSTNSGNPEIVTILYSTRACLLWPMPASRRNASMIISKE